MSQKLHYQ